MLGHGLNLARRGVAVWAALAIVWALTSCTTMNNEQIHIRIRNATDTDMTAFWLGAGSGAGGPGSRAYGAIARAETTPYRSLKAQFGAYSNYNFLAASGRRYMGSVVPSNMFGRFALDPGYYTFVLTIDRDTSQLEIVHDEPR
jgi:hypothetical protein